MYLSAASSVSSLRRQLENMRALATCGDGELYAESKLSAWTPCEHLDHLTKVTRSIIDRLLEDDPPAGTRGMSVIGWMIHLTGWIPRGRGKAPERLRGSRVNGADLNIKLNKLADSLAQLSDAHIDDARGAIVPHPKFGDLRPSQALRFAAVHIDHHLKIVEDILKK